MFRKEFAEVISSTGMVPVKDLRPMLQNKEENKISEFDLLNLEFFDDLKFAKASANKFKLPFVDLSKAKISDHMLNFLKKSDIIKYRVVPIKRTEKSIAVAIYDPSIVENKSEIQTLCQGNVDFVMTSISAWQILFSKVRSSVNDILGTIEEVNEFEAREENVKEEDIGSEVVSYANKILALAFIDDVSDIHIESYEKSARIRFRKDGTLVEIERPEKKLYLPLVSRIKLMAKMDISEKRKPQDGRIKLRVDGRNIDYRVSSLPTLFGEKIVLRLLDQSNLQLDMTNLGFEKSQLDVFKNAIHQPYGMCLVTGPTGSGKTTTLYSAVADLNDGNSNISTCEDPVEFNLEGINQVNVRKEAGLTFASSLKAFLRQDPDIIMVGEIRDLEVAEIAVEAALTGHLVFSTLHTNDAPSTVTRFINMGIEPYLLVGSLNVVVAQRLLRKICSGCKVEDTEVTAEHMVACGISPNSASKIKAYKGEGCQICANTGYKGRVAVYEVMEVTPNLREAILNNAGFDELKLTAVKDGMKTLRMSALTKFAQGLTTLAEAIANTATDKFK